VTASLSAGMIAATCMPPRVPHNAAVTHAIPSRTP
jgi:hypothetical protein